MNARGYLQRVTELALESGRPLHDELDAAAREIPFTVRWSLAARHAKEGTLSLALALLPVHALAAACALIEPRAAGAVGRRLRALPTTFDLAAPVLVPLAYVTALLLAQLGAVQLLSWKVVPILSIIPGTEPGPPLGVVAALVVGALVVLWSAVILSLQVRSQDGLAARLFELLRGARLLAAAAELAAHGRPPVETIPRLAGAAGLSDSAVGTLVGNAPPDGAACDELSAWLAERARLRFVRIGAVLKTAGTMTAVVIGLLMLLAVYLPISAVPRMAELP